MGKVWVLDTETKGTGAEMVPLERALERKRSAPAAMKPSVARAPSPGREKAAEPAEPREPLRFRLVNVLTQQALGDDVPARKLVELLAGVDSVVDVRIYVWEPELDDWRPLTLGEKKAIWSFRQAA